MWKFALVQPRPLNIRTAATGRRNHAYFVEAANKTRLQEKHVFADADADASN